MKNPALLSIVTVVYNDLENFKRTRTSVESQSQRGFEWIVVDGESTDGTLEELASVDGLSLRYCSEPDEGIYDAMNKGLRLASGEYIIFLNAGDCFADSSTLETILEILERPEANIDFIYGDAIERSATESCTVKPARSHQMIWYGMFTHHQAMIYRRRLAAGVAFKTSYEIAGDYDFTVRFLRRTRNIYRCNFPICIFGKGGVSERRQKLGRKENFRIQTQNLRLGRLAAGTIRVFYLLSVALRTAAPGCYALLRYRPLRK